MKIGIDARWLGAQGAGRYISNMIRELQSLDGKNRYFVYCTPDVKDLPLKNSLWQRRTFPETRIVGSLQLWLDDTWRGLDIFWATNQLLPRVCSTAMFKILTVHDLVWKLFPETMRRDNYELHKKRFNVSVLRANRIVTGSVATRNSLSEMPRMREDKISVIPYGVDPVFSPQDKTSSARYIACKYGVSEHYICTVGTIEPRKDQVTLIQAMRILRDRGPLAHQLVIAGGPGWKNEEIYASVQTCGLGEREVKFMGRVPEEDLPRLYSGAGLFVYPSLYEGFGFPLVEAMACGAPVVSSDAPAMPEVAQGAAILVSRGRPEELAGAINRVLENEALRESLIEKGLRRAGDFRWQTAAEAMLQVFAEAPRAASRQVVKGNS
jgi:glycosyltransferase involved in cell wall biosynthesis